VALLVGHEPAPGRLITQTIDSVSPAPDAEQSVTASAGALAARLLTIVQGPDVDRPEVWEFIAALGEQAAALLPEFETFANSHFFGKPAFFVPSLWQLYRDSMRPKRSSASS
jgi:hypothetical protein